MEDAPNSELKFCVSGIELDTLELLYLFESTTFETFENLFIWTDFFRSFVNPISPRLGCDPSIFSWLEGFSLLVSIKYGIGYTIVYRLQYRLGYISRCSLGCILDHKLRCRLVFEHHNRINVACAFTTVGHGQINFKSGCGCRNTSSKVVR